MGRLINGHDISWWSSSNLMSPATVTYGFDCHSCKMTSKNWCSAIDADVAAEDHAGVHNTLTWLGNGYSVFDGFALVMREHTEHGDILRLYERENEDKCWTYIQTFDLADAVECRKKATEFVARNDIRHGFGKEHHD